MFDFSSIEYICLIPQTNAIEHISPLIAHNSHLPEHDLCRVVCVAKHPSLNPIQIPELRKNINSESRRQWAILVPWARS